MSRSSRLFFFIALFAASSCFLTAQVKLENEGLAVFSLSHYSWQVPGGAFSLVDEQIEEIFVRFGRFDVISLAYKLDAAGIERLLSTMQEIGGHEGETEETVRLGQEVFSGADFQTLMGVGVAVVPVTTKYSLERVSQNQFTSRIEVSLTFIDVQKAEVFDSLVVEADARGETARDAVQKAADKIVLGLVPELKGIPEFQLLSGIVSIREPLVYLSFGKNMEVAVGDEYALVAESEAPNGDRVEEETGLLIVNEVRDELSVATLIYTDDTPSLENRLRAVPRLGLDTGAYARTILAADIFGSLDVLGAVGVRQSISRGFMRYRPLLGLEVPFLISGERVFPGLLINVYAGGEINWYLWRLQFVPSMGLGVGGNILFGEGDGFSISHAGGFADMAISYLVGRSVKVSLSVGLTGWFKLSEAAGDSYYGLHFGIGGTFKY